MGVIASALRVAEFDLARVEAEKLHRADPNGPDAMALYGDALWSSGLFQEAEAQYRDALAGAPELARGHHGMARSLAARSHLDEAMNEAQAALRLSPRDLEIHHTVGTIYERHAQVRGGGGRLLELRQPAAEQGSQREGRLVARRNPVPALVRPARAVRERSGHRRPAVHRRLPAGEREGRGPREGQRRVGAGLRRRHRRRRTPSSRAPTAQRLGITPVTYTLSAGVGRVGLRGLQLARIDSLELGSLKLRNVPCLIKNPPLRDIPVKETEGLSPLALGYSMVIDYKTHKLTFGKHLPEEPKDFELPLRLHRLATVRGDGRRQPPGELRRRHRRRSDLDQPGDRDGAGQAARPAAGSR